MYREYSLAPRYIKLRVCVFWGAKSRGRASYPAELPHPRRMPGGVRLDDEDYTVIFGPDRVSLYGVMKMTVRPSCVFALDQQHAVAAHLRSGDSGAQ